MRRLVRIIVCLLLGAAMTVGVAWLIAWQGDRTPIMDIESRWPTDVPASWPYWSEPGVNLPPLKWAHATDERRSTAEYTQTRRATRAVWSIRVEYLILFHTQRVVGVGFPLPALWMGEWSFGMTPERPTERPWPAKGLVGGFEPHPVPMAFGQPLDRGQLRLPVMPLYFGLAFNTVFYGGVVYVLWVGVPVLIRRRRLSHGKCPTCKYPLGPSPVCTECGAKIPGRAVQPAIAVSPQPEGLDRQ